MQLRQSDSSCHSRAYRNEAQVTLQDAQIIPCFCMSRICKNSCLEQLLRLLCTPLHPPPRYQAPQRRACTQRIRTSGVQIAAHALVWSWPGLCTCIVYNTARLLRACTKFGLCCRAVWKQVSARSSHRMSRHTTPAQQPQPQEQVATVHVEGSPAAYRDAKQLDDEQVLLQVCMQDEWEGRAAGPQGSHLGCSKPQHWTVPEPGRPAESRLHGARHAAPWQHMPAGAGPARGGEPAPGLLAELHTCPQRQLP